MQSTASQPSYALSLRHLFAALRVVTRVSLLARRGLKDASLWSDSLVESKLCRTYYMLMR